MKVGQEVAVIGTVVEIFGVEDGPWRITIEEPGGDTFRTVGEGTFYRKAQLGDRVRTTGYLDARGNVVRVKYVPRDQDNWERQADAWDREAPSGYDTPRMES